MSHPLEQRTCPDCGAVFYLIPGIEAELPPHGCGESAEHKQSSAQSPQPSTNPAPASTGQAGPDPPADRPDLFHALQDQTSDQANPAHPASDPPTGTGELKDHTAKSLRDQGYVLTEDARGLRISGSPYGGPTGSTLSPSDIVRIAAELDGGVKQAGTLQICAKCQARTPAGEAKCQWCGEPFSTSG